MYYLSFLLFPIMLRPIAFPLKNLKPPALPRLAYAFMASPLVPRAPGRQRIDCHNRIHIHSNNCIIVQKLEGEN